MSEVIITPETVARLAQGELARRALKWMLEHRVYYDPRHGTLLEPVSLAGRKPIAQPPDDVALFLFEAIREIELEAENAG